MILIGANWASQHKQYIFIVDCWNKNWKNFTTCSTSTVGSTNFLCCPFMQVVNCHPVDRCSSPLPNHHMCWIESMSSIHSTSDSIIKLSTYNNEWMNEWVGCYRISLKLSLSLSSAPTLSGPKRPDVDSQHSQHFSHMILCVLLVFCPVNLSHDVKNSIFSVLCIFEMISPFITRELNVLRDVLPACRACWAV